MKFRAPDLVLAVIIAIGSFFAWQTGWERYKLSKTVERLSAKTGDLLIADPSMVYVQALPTGEPLHFAWRVYLPANYKLNLREGSGGQTSSSSTSPSDFIARVRFREYESGDLHVYTRFEGGSSRSNLGDKTLARLLHNRWDKLQIKQLGADEVAVFAPNHAVTLLQLTLSEEMRQEARKTLAPDLQETYVPDLFKMELGPEPQSTTMSGSVDSQGE